MGVVYVAHLETSTLAAQTAGAESRETALVSDLGQRVCLVHELAQGVGAEERVDDAGDGLGVDEVGGCEHLIITHIHALADGAAHTGQTDGKLVGQLLAYSAHAAVGEVVDIIDLCLGIDQLNEVLDNLNNIFTRKHTHVGIRIEVELAVDAVATYVAQVVALLGEEEVVDDFARTGIVGGVGITQLAIDVEHSFLLGVGRILGQRVEDDAVVAAVGVFLMYENRLGTAVENICDIVVGEQGLAVHDDLVTLNRNDFARVFIHEVLNPRLQHTCCQLLAHHLLEVGLVDLDLFGEVEDFEDILIVLETDSTQQRRDRQLLLTVDVSVHHIADVCSKLYPRALERNNTCAVERRTIGVETGTEEHTRRTVQLTHYDTLGAIDDEGAVGRHVRDGTEEHVLNDGVEILVVRVGAVELQLSLQRHSVGQTTLQTLFDTVTRRVDVIVEELENEIVARVRDGEVLGENFVQAVVLAQFGRRV